MAKIEIEMTLEKSTKNKHVYGNVDSGIKSVYIEKDALPSKPPESGKMTFEYKD